MQHSNNSDETQSKADKIKGTDKGDHANKETAFVGLEINVKPFRKWLKEHYDSHSDSRDKSLKSIGIINAHYIVAAVDQIIIFSLLHSLSDSFKKTTSGLYDITLESMKNHIRLTPYLNNTYYLCVDKFDENLDYQKQLCIDRKSLDQYITKYVFNDNFRMVLNKDSKNFLAYLILQSNVMLANTSLVMSEFAKKSRVNANAVISALKVHFTGKLYEDIMKKVDSVITMLKNKEKQNSEKGDKDDSDTEDKTETKTEEKTKNKKSEDSDEESDKEESDKEDSDKEDSDKEEEEEEVVNKKADKKVDKKADTKNKSNKKVESDSESEEETKPVKKTKTPVKKVSKATK